MLSGNSNEKGQKKISRSNLVKKLTLHVQHTFYGGNVVCVPVHFFLLLLTFPLVAATTSHFPNALQNVHVLIPTKFPLFFIFRSSSFSVIQVNVHL